MRVPSVKPNSSPEVARALPKAAPMRAEPAAEQITKDQTTERGALTPPKPISAHTSNVTPNVRSNATLNQAEWPAASVSTYASVPASSVPSPSDASECSELSTARPEGSSGGSTDLAALAEQWQSIVNQLGLKAYARQLPYQSELIELSATRLVLRCEKASLVSDDKALKVLRQSLDEYFSAHQQPTPTLRVHIAESGQVRFSPQKLALQEREAHLGQARAAITQHPTIQQIVHEFDGMILPNSIMPE